MVVSQASHTGPGDCLQIGATPIDCTAVGLERQRGYGLLHGRRERHERAPHKRGDRIAAEPLAGGAVGP